MTYINELLLFVLEIVELHELISYQEQIPWLCYSDF